MKENNQMPFQKRDIQIINLVDSKKKYDIEKSKCYIGYKLLWIIDMYLQGRQFPYGSLSAEKYKHEVLKIAQQVSQATFTKVFMEFDAKVYLQVVSRLFYGQPYWFLDRIRNEAGATATTDPKAILRIISEEVRQQSEAFQDKQQQTLEKQLGPHYKKHDVTKDFLEEAAIIQDFNAFLINIQIEHYAYQNKLTEEQRKQEQKNTGSSGSRLGMQQVGWLKIEYKPIFDAIKQAIKELVDKKNSNAAYETKSEEQRLIEALVSLESRRKEGAENLLSYVSEIDPRTNLLSLRIYLLEDQGDYLQTFRLIMMEQEKKVDIFQWI